jgi:valyl-tRNA synthetase
MAAKATLYRVIWTFIRLFAPICPHITEEIYQKVCREGEGAISVPAAQCPRSRAGPPRMAAGEHVVKALAALRAKKVEMKVALSAEVRLAGSGQRGGGEGLQGE